MHPKEMKPWGLSPRVRGNRTKTRMYRRGTRSIPACAGEPAAAGRFWTACRVYPRVCGGTNNQGIAGDKDAGLSPRVRGNHDQPDAGVNDGGSIPACAGEPLRMAVCRMTSWVYPRVCGGTPPRPVTCRPAAGLSPRVRGNLASRSLALLASGSIPACAGEPKRRRPARAKASVYPRVCGGTPDVGREEPRAAGLSPRVRGNPRMAPPGIWRRRSIPACAGEPPERSYHGSDGQVYPRVCGGTHCQSYHWCAYHGLSPRVRGNPERQNRRSPNAGSIPACAGEPWIHRRLSAVSAVYPRVCGGTQRGRASKPDAGGLSPRVRGNRLPPPRTRQSYRSIPACAGEPAKYGVLAARIKVYPRVCGGTLECLPRLAIGQGLSPRVRGNPPRPHAATLPPRSIPACAGEPCNGAAEQTPIWVYPRVCGGTGWRGEMGSERAGLSPRVRGNPSHIAALIDYVRSIPACAGEPQPFHPLVGAG